ncbi:peptidoglycan DD-metalloendopeptidase family protein [Paenibacillus sp. N3.4]|uniref:peptidoglycan DD-metalloendopeptidase family protein n=1 Tax=Paenibacillus sp. N3.4 TaxID=2603222 RepID=UPI0011C711EF|nr:peptidoglycan DD-metalloendopeptidase family protein [Paenibacillus sp. N3.4]TXK84729.1 peptidoglycan DD-metalloendopeptidase family protein [Paenibacillus sp. N3.4]
MEVKDKVKQRRLERLRNLRDMTEAGQVSRSRGSTGYTETVIPNRNQTDLPLYADADWKRRMEDPEYAWQHKIMMDRTLNGLGSQENESGLLAPPSPRKIVIKLFVSCILFAGLFGMFQLNQPWANKGKQIVAASLTQSYDFTAISMWYTERFGGAPSFIPSFHREGDDAVRVNATKRTFFSPAKGSVLIPYDGTTHLGVKLNTAEYAPVYALDTGQVIYSGTVADTGLTVIIRHAGGLQSLYGSLSEAHVTVGDWMKIGEVVGKASSKDPSKGSFYFAVTKDGRPINPSDVITLIKWAGTTYRFHPLFTLIMIGSAITGYFLEAVTLFAIVLVHELGHLAAANGFGWRVREVQFLPFGGVVIVDELGTVPTREELLVALAGPLQHVWMILAALLMKGVGLGSISWWDYFIEANLMIGLFNLLPVMPLDGGKVLQSLLSYIMSYHNTILYSAWISMILSMMIIGISCIQLISGQLPLNMLVIGIFLLVSNWYAYRQLPYHFFRFLISRGYRVSQLLSRGVLAQPIIVTRQRTMADTLKLFMREKYHLIYVVNEKGRIQAILPEQQLVSGYLDGKKPGSAVSDLFM